MKYKVAVIPCKTYEEKTVKQAILGLFEMLEIKKHDFKNKRILLKPNLCLPVTSDRGITTHPEILRQLSKCFINWDKDILIADTHIGYGDKERTEAVWKETGVNALMDEGLAVRNDLDCRYRQMIISTEEKNYTLPISDLIFQCDVINVPKLKTHEYMMLTGCIKNMYGILGGDSKRKMHHVAGNKKQFGQLLSSIYNVSQTKLNVVDAICGLEGDGPGVKGMVRKYGYLVAGQNGAATDYVLSRMLGIPREDVFIEDIANICEEDIELLGASWKECEFPDVTLPTITRRMDRILEHALQLKRAILQIDNQKCCRCGRCMADCPGEALHLGQSGIEIDGSKCIACLVCAETCLNSVFTIRKKILLNQL